MFIVWAFHKCLSMWFKEVCICENWDFEISKVSEIPNSSFQIPNSSFQIPNFHIFRFLKSQNIKKCIFYNSGFRKKSLWFHLRKKWEIVSFKMYLKYSVSFLKILLLVVPDQSFIFFSCWSFPCLLFVLCCILCLLYFSDFFWLVLPPLG